MTMVTVRSEPPHRTQIAWKSWGEWRIGKVCPENVEFREPAEAKWKPRADYCFTCSGNGSFHDPVEAANGEGRVLAKKPCPTCGGKGSA